MLHALRDRLTVEEATHLGAQLPMLIRGFYYEGWTLSDKPTKERHKEDFLAHIKHVCRNDERMDPEQIVRGVFRVLARRISKGEIEDIKHLLPAEPHERCHGVQIIVVDRQVLDAAALRVEIASALYRLYPRDFQLSKTLDLIGARWVLQAIKDGQDPRAIRRNWQAALDEFCMLRTKYLLYSPLRLK